MFKEGTYDTAGTVCSTVPYDTSTVLLLWYQVYSTIPYYDTTDHATYSTGTGTVHILAAGVIICPPTVQERRRLRSRNKSIILAR